MHLLLGLALGVVGGLIFGEGGFLFGALLGLGAGYIRALHLDVRKLNIRLDLLDGRAAEPPQSTDELRPQPAAPRPAEAESTAQGQPTRTGQISQPVSQSQSPDWSAEEPVEPAEPAVASRFQNSVRTLVTSIVTFFTTGNLVVRIGVVVLFFGVAFLLRYAYENALLPVELRLAGSAAGGIFLAIVGWRLRERSDTYGVVLQGAGVGLLYLTIFAASRMYDLLPIPAAFGMLVVLVIASSLLAVRQNAQALAIFSMAGGFLAPVLLSTDTGSHVALFSYYALLNGGILAMAWFRFWRWLNWVGFIFTFAIGATWGYQYYKPEYFSTTEPFLILFFFYYVGVSLLFARRKEVDLKGIVDGTLVFGTPIIAFALQAALVSDREFGLAFSALGAAATYVLLAVWLKRQDAFSNLLGQSFIALGVVFATLAIPFAFDNQRFTGATWALEGAGLLWVGLRQKQMLPRVFGMLLQIAAAAAFLSGMVGSNSATLLLNSTFLGAVMLSLAGGYSAYLLSTRGAVLHRFETMARWFFLLWGTLWWYFGWLHEIDSYQPSWYGRFDSNNVNENLFVLLAGTTTAGLVVLARRWNWREVLLPGYFLLPMLIVGLFALDRQWDAQTPLHDLGWLAWPVAFAGLFWHLHNAVKMPRPLPLWHAASWWFTALFSAWTAVALTHQALPDTAWESMLWGAVPLVLVVGLLSLKDRDRWPLTDSLDSYLGWGMGLLLGALLVWLLIIGAQPADPSPLPYIVLINPIEMTQLAIIFVTFAWTRQLTTTRLSGQERPLRITLAAMAFIWLNLTAARAVHYYGDVSYPLEVIFETDAFQTTATILWTLTALVLMGIGTRRRLRPSWIVGASLLGVVILKLFTLDLSNLDVVARIISFISVGVLMLLIGYLAPLPPAREEVSTT